MGREREWGTFTWFAARRTPGYLLIEAPAGYGKSAFMAQLIHRRETSRWPMPAPSLVYFFIRAEGGRNTPTDFLQAVNAQLLDLLKVRCGTSADLGELRAQFGELWSAAAASASVAAPLLLIVDGLDESASGSVTIADVLPSGLGDYVHVAVSSRPNPAPVLQVGLEHPLRRADVVRLQTLDRSDIHALLREYSVTDGAATDLVPGVLAVTRGEALLARFVCQEVATGGRPLLNRFEKNPPADVEDYFRRQLNQLSAAADDSTWEILGLLVVARGGLTIAEMADLLKVGKRQASRALESIRRFLLGDPRFELMHLQLRKVAAEGFTADEKAAYSERLLRWCRGYEERGWPEDTPEYILAHYAAHLLAADNKDGLYALITKRWMKLKLARTHSSRAFAEDVALEIEVAQAEPRNVVQEVRGSLIHATVGKLVSDVPVGALEALTLAGRSGAARGWASLIQDQDAWVRAHARIGRALLERRDVARREELGMLTEEARVVLLQAVAGISALDRESQRELLGDLGPSLAASLLRVGELARLRAAVDATGDKTLAEETLITIAEACARSGELDEALRVAEAFADDDRVWILGYVVRALPLPARFAEALEIATAIKDVPVRAWALSGISVALAQAGDREKAADAAEKMTALLAQLRDERDIDWLLRDGAQALADVGRFDEALALTVRIENDVTMALAQGTVSLALSR